MGRVRDRGNIHIWADSNDRPPGGGGGCLVTLIVWCWVPLNFHGLYEVFAPIKNQQGVGRGGVMVPSCRQLVPDKSSDAIQPSTGFL